MLIACCCHSAAVAHADIQRGMGSVMVKSGNGTFVLRAMFCPPHSYGVSAP